MFSTKKNKKLNLKNLLFVFLFSFSFSFSSAMGMSGKEVAVRAIGNSSTILKKCVPIVPIAALSAWGGYLSRSKLKKTLLTGLSLVGFLKSNKVSTSSIKIFFESYCKGLGLAFGVSSGMALGFSAIAFAAWKFIRPLEKVKNVFAEVESKVDEKTEKTKVEVNNLIKKVKSEVGTFKKEAVKVYEKIGDGVNKKLEEVKKEASMMRHKIEKVASVPNETMKKVKKAVGDYKNSYKENCKKDIKNFLKTGSIIRSLPVENIEDTKPPLSKLLDPLLERLVNGYNGVFNYFRKSKNNFQEKVVCNDLHSKLKRDGVFQKITEIKQVVGARGKKDKVLLEQIEKSEKERENTFNKMARVKRSIDVSSKMQLGGNSDVFSLGPYDNDPGDSFLNSLREASKEYKKNNPNVINYENLKLQRSNVKTFKPDSLF